MAAAAGAARLRATARRLARERSQQWALCLLAGVCCGAMAFAINAGCEAMDKLRYELVMRFISPGGGFVLPWVVFNAVSCALAAVAGAGVAYVSPLAAGSGIPHIKAFCGGADIPGLLTLKTLLVKATGAMFSIGSGLIAGKEGPFIQCGACIASLLLQVGHRGREPAGGAARGHEGERSAGRRATWLARIGAGWRKRQRRQQQQQQQPTVAAASEAPDPLPAGGLDHAATPAPEAGEAALAQPAVGEEGQQLQSEREGGGALRGHPNGQRPQPGETSHLQLQRDAELARWRVERDARLRRGHLEQHAAVGAGAGVAAAFVAPLSAAAYYAEEATSHFSAMRMGQAVLAGGVTVFSMWLLTRARVDGGALRGTMFSSPLSLAFRGSLGGQDARFWWYCWELLPAAALGALGGAAMAAWTACNARLQLGRRALLRRRSLKVADVVLCCLLTNTIRLLAARFSPCSPMPASADLQLVGEQVTSWALFPAPFGLFPQLWCPDGSYSVYGQLFMLPLEVAVRSLFSFEPPRGGRLVLNTPAAGARGGTPEAEGPYVFDDGALAAYTAFVWGMLLLSYGIAAPTGIFIPALAIGAAGGRLAGHGIDRLLRAAGAALPVCMPGWSVLGAAAALAGCTRLTLANCLIVLESSGAVPMVVPMALLMVVAKLSADRIFVGIYDFQIEAAGEEFMHPEDALRSGERAALREASVLDLLLGLSAQRAAQQEILAQDEESAGAVPAPEDQRNSSRDWSGCQNERQRSKGSGGEGASIGDAATAAATQGQQQQQQGTSLPAAGGSDLPASGGSCADGTQPAAGSPWPPHQAQQPSVQPPPAPPRLPQQQAAQPQQQLAASDEGGSLGGPDELVPPGWGEGPAVVLVGASSSAGVAYSAMRQLALHELPVVAAAASAESRHGGGGGGPPLLLGTLRRKDLTPGGIQAAIEARDKRE